MKTAHTSLQDLDQDFLDRHMIENPEYLDEGDIGTAFTCGDGRILKVTPSHSEYEIGKQLLHKNLDHIVDYYAAEKVGNRYYLLMEEITIMSSVEYLFYDVMHYLQYQNLSLGEIDSFDKEDYEKDAGDEIPAKQIRFMEELSDLLDDIDRVTDRYRADIHPGNLGRDSIGTLKAFDIMSK